MKLYYSTLLRVKVRALDVKTKKALKKALHLMAGNPRHPSLITKKIQGTADLFEARITRACRLTWRFFEEGILLRNIGEHDETLKKP